ncbi:MAG TPA: tetratricopeptide repeat protein, partial [Pyrinomonadaceae bacterium]|nr:tetratricopeptide repeat protein [Pyrinomonadaceae bacterium]
DAPAQGRAGRRARAGAARRSSPAAAAEDGRAAAFIEEGLRRSEAGNWDEAIKAFRQAVAVSSRHPDAHVHLGDAYMGAGKYEEAFAAYRQAVHVAPWNADAHYSLGAAFNDMGQHGDSFKHFVQAIRLDPEYAEAYYGIGFAYQRLDNYREALGYLKSALRLRPDYPEARLSLGLTYLGLGDRKAAEEQLRLLEAEDAGLARMLRGQMGVAAANGPASATAGREAAGRVGPETRPASEASPPARRETRTQSRAESKPAGDAARTRPRPDTPAPSLTVELAFWDSIKNSTDPEEFAAYLKRFPEGEFADLARIRLRALGGRKVEPAAPAAGAAETTSAAALQKAPGETEAAGNSNPPGAAGNSNPPKEAAAVVAQETSSRPAAGAGAQTAQEQAAQPAEAAATPAQAAPSPAPTAEASTAAAPAQTPPAGAPQPERPATLEETLEWLRSNFSTRFTYSYTTRGGDPAAPPSTAEARISYEPVLFQGCNMEWRDAADTLAVSLSELDPQGVRVEPRREPDTTFSAEVWNLVLSATGGARAFREIKGDGSGAMNSYHSVTLQFNSRDRAERLAERLRHAIKLCGGKSAPF